MFHIIIKQSSLKRKKGAKKLAAVEKIFAAKGLSYEVHKTVEKTEPKELAQKITSDKGNTVVVMGGDGTLHEVLNGFSDFENNSLALIPFGTGNDFAESAKIPLNVKKAATLRRSENGLQRQKQQKIEVSAFAHTLPNKVQKL